MVTSSKGLCWEKNASVLTTEGCVDRIGTDGRGALKGRLSGVRVGMDAFWSAGQSSERPGLATFWVAQAADLDERVCGFAEEATVFELPLLPLLVRLGRAFGSDEKE